MMAYDHGHSVQTSLPGTRLALEIRHRRRGKTQAWQIAWQLELPTVRRPYVSLTSPPGDDLLRPSPSPRFEIFSQRAHIGVTQVSGTADFGNPAG